MLIYVIEYSSKGSNGRWSSWLPVTHWRKRSSAEGDVDRYRFEERKGARWRVSTYKRIPPPRPRAKKGKR